MLMHLPFDTYSFDEKKVAHSIQHITRLYQFEAKSQIYLGVSAAMLR